MYAKGFRIHQPIGFEINMEVIARQATVHHFNGTNLNDLVAFAGAPIWFIPVVSVSRTIWRVIAVLIAVIYVRLVVLQFDSITGSLPEMLKQVEIFTDGSCLQVITDGLRRYFTLSRTRENL